MAKGEYEVGFGKPPRRTRFRPGQSGNPRGRPRGMKNFSTAFKRELQARVPITDNGKRKMLSARDIIAKRLIHKALQGDLRSMMLLLQQVSRFEQPEAAPEFLNSAQDQEVIEGILDRVHSSREDALNETQSETLHDLDDQTDSESSPEPK
jgi:hypothetical protein